MVRVSDEHESYLELCELSALGVLEFQDRERLARHLADGCAECEARLHECREIAADLAEEAAAPLEPRAAVRRELFARIDAAEAGELEKAKPGGVEPEPADEPSHQPWKGWSRDDASKAAGFLFKKFDEGAWEPTGVEGIEVRSLFVDPANNRMTALFRMAPGTTYIPHRHDGAEECYVVEGDLRVGDVVMHAGDYQHAAEGSIHGEQSTENGCVLLISSSMSDQLL